MSYINEQMGVDLSEYRNTKREKRGEVIVKWDDLTRNQQNSIKDLVNKYGRFELVDYGGWGMRLKPKKDIAALMDAVEALNAKVDAFTKSQTQDDEPKPEEAPAKATETLGELEKEQMPVKWGDIFSKPPMRRGTPLSCAAATFSVSKPPMRRGTDGRF